MENTFSTNASETIQKQIELNETNEINSDEINANLELYFDIEKSANWIIKNKFQRVALQFPDELLQYSANIYKKLETKCSQLDGASNDERYIFILGDTSYGSCCIDVVSAEHYNADSLIHYGHSCLNKTEKLPVLFIFEKYNLYIDLLKNELNKIIDKISINEYQEKKILIIYDVSYYHLHDKLKQLENDRVIVSDLQIDAQESTQNFVIYSRVLPNDLEDKDKRMEYIIFYIGNKELFLNTFQLYFNKNKFFNLNNTKIESYTDTNRKLMKRYYLIEKAKDAKIFGILVGTMSILKYKEAINHASNILRNAKKKYYSFLIGKLNCAKLNNFMEVDMYILIACNENSIINSKELNKPIITLYELEIAFNSARLWGEEFVCDYSQLLTGMRHYVPLEISNQESDVSLISGEVRHTRQEKDVVNENNALIKRDEALAVMHYDGAGEFLTSRSWKGLEQNLGKTPVTAAVQGKTGIAMGYEDEIDENIQ